MRKIPVAGRKFINSEVKKMKELTLVDTRDVEIIKEDDGTYRIEFYYEEDLVIAINEQTDIEEGIEKLKELARKHLYLDIDILTCVELILVKAYRSGSSIALSFRDTNSGKVYEINFDGVGCTSIADFIDNHKKRLFDMFRGSLKVDIVGITF